MQQCNTRKYPGQVLPGLSHAELPRPRRRRPWLAQAIDAAAVLGMAVLIIVASAAVAREVAWWLL